MVNACSLSIDNIIIGKEGVHGGGFMWFGCDGGGMGLVWGVGMGVLNNKALERLRGILYV